MAQSTEDFVPKMRKSKYGKICSAIGCSNYQYSKDRQKLKQQDIVVIEKREEECTDAAHHNIIYYYYCCCCLFSIYNLIIN